VDRRKIAVAECSSTTGGPTTALWDSLSAMLAAEVQADLLILMSDVDGIYNKPPWEDGAKLMHTYSSDDSSSIEFGKKSKVILPARNLNPLI